VPAGEVERKNLFRGKSNHREKSEKLIRAGDEFSSVPSVVNLMEPKSQKELAFLQDLYVATDWGERFAALVDDHVELPEEGRALYVGAGTGGHALAVQERAGDRLKLMCADANDDCLELARAKAVAFREGTEFQREHLNALSFTDNQFDLVLGDASLTAPGDLKALFAEMARVAKPTATVALWCPTATSFGEFFSIYWEALQSAGLQDRAGAVEHLISDVPTVFEVERWAEKFGLEDVVSWTAIEEFDYESGEQFFNSPLITDFLLPNWLTLVPEDKRESVTKALANIIDEERHSGAFALTLKATLVMGKKRPLQ
jgi:ubiquinone/menaquinone biosynthesis C-methylase UbiE